MNKNTFNDLLSGTIRLETDDKVKEYTLSGITIPMIQRDYAQGRLSEYEVRRRFLDVIFGALVNDEELELDFIYGSIESLDDKQYFIPLDGQQRLTMLFLLYWYIASRELDICEFAKLQARLIKFSYSTRPTARNFCEKLCTQVFNIGNKPSLEITESQWFYEAYNQDPTVKSMLVVLDEIHERYIKQQKVLYTSLDKIGFYVLPLDGFHLTDELYIKMNARGKQLTDFENFKADLINWVQTESEANSDLSISDVVYDERTMPYSMMLGLKLDNDWTKLFWNFRKKGIKKQTGETIDLDYMRFWNRYALHDFIVKEKVHPEVISHGSFFKRRYDLESAFRYQGFKEYNTVFKKINDIQRIESVLDKLAIHYSTVNELIKPSWQMSDNWELFANAISQRQRLIFFALTKYLEQDSYSEIELRKWMRIVWNIAIDPDMRSIPSMVSIMRIINQISDYSKDIYSYLVSTECAALIKNDKSFVSAQLQEEAIKAKLILSDAKWEEYIVKAESHPLFTGNINFLIGDEPSLDIFLQRFEIAKSIFNGTGLGKTFKNEFLLIRGFIASLTNWNDLYTLSFADSKENWQLLLRRNRLAQNFIKQLCDLPNVDAVLDRLNNIVIKTSSITTWNNGSSIKSRHAHEQLYIHSDFHDWLQEHSAVNLKFVDEHLYVYRPRSWYDWVMIDVFRNEIISEMAEKFGFNTTNNRCNDSDFYWGSIITIEKRVGENVVSADFLNRYSIKVGVKDNGFSKAKNFTTPSNENGWLFCMTYDYNSINSEAEVQNLIEIIRNDIFDDNNPNSLVSQL